MSIRHKNFNQKTKSQIKKKNTVRGTIECSVDIVSSCTQFPQFQNTFRLDESFLVDWNDHMIQINPLCGIIDCWIVPYSLLFDTIVFIETHFSWSPA